MGFSNGEFGFWVLSLYFFMPFPFLSPLASRRLIASTNPFEHRAVLLSRGLTRTQLGGRYAHHLVTLLTEAKPLSSRSDLSLSLYLQYFQRTLNISAEEVDKNAAQLLSVAAHHVGRGSAVTVPLPVRKLSHPIDAQCHDAHHSRISWFGS